MRKSHAKWIEFLYGPFFKVIGFFYRSYTANRARIAALKANAKVAVFLRAITVLVLVGWILTWFFFPQGDHGTGPRGMDSDLVLRFRGKPHSPGRRGQAEYRL